MFGSILGGMDDDFIFGSAIRHMSNVDHMMSSMLHHHPFSMDNIFRGFGSSRSGMHGMMPSFGMPMMPSFGRMLNGSMGALGSPMPGNCNFSSSSTVISMTSGPDGRPQVYKETSSTKVAPGGIKETQRTVTDSVSGTKKMEIGHHIGDRAHIIEKEQNLHTGDREEREDFINLDEEQAEDFNKEWTTKTRRRSGLPRISSGVVRNRPAIGHGCCSIPPLTATYSICSDPICTMPVSHTLACPRKVSRFRKIRANRSSSSPYHVSGQGKLRKSRNLKSVSGPSNDKSA
ncbi:myeloid leukemia factor isoform X2 [Dendroctonus ponderosae]|uniref:Myeloid leukemia factor n=1 Tax=Dendroctonus ponderosae TaxID=77166 RepID=A0AAR5QED1_DENPD|nr:myeloid leukemia factor isoform X2 [Dendroctonus ponderosae]